MTDWMRRARAALVLSNLVPSLQWPYAVDMWPQTLAIPGFLCGAVFGVVLSIAAGRRQFDQLSLAGFAALGALAGGGLGLLTGAPAFILAPLTVVSAASAAGTLAIARTAARRELRP